MVRNGKTDLNMVFLSIFSALMSADIARIFDQWSVAVLTITVHFFFLSLFILFQIGCFLH